MVCLSLFAKVQPKEHATDRHVVHNDVQLDVLGKGTAEETRVHNHHGVICAFESMRD